MDLSEVADHVGISPDYLRHCFADRYGMSLKRCHLVIRINRAKQLLAHSVLTAKEIAGDGGFANDRHFSSRFRQEVGMSPIAFRQTCRGAAVDVGIKPRSDRGGGR